MPLIPRLPGTGYRTIYIEDKSGFGTGHYVTLRWGARIRNSSQCTPVRQPVGTNNTREPEYTNYHYVDPISALISERNTIFCDNEGI